jgi:hypothetical protein
MSAGFFTDLSQVHFDGHGIASAGEYKPWGRHKDAGGDGSNYPIHSGKILDLKDGHDHAVAHFFQQLDGIIAPGVAIAIVPSHDPDKRTSALKKLAQALAASKNRIDASHCLVRHTKIAKLASGGDRSIEVHANSLRVDDAIRISFETVVVLDDVTTSGNSLLACRNLLLAADAAGVQCLAIGRTV